jgi:hypothetical protein
MLLWMKCSLNLACCRLRQGNYRQCLAECDALKEGESAGSTSGSVHVGQQLAVMGGSQPLDVMMMLT